ncbi:RibD family protein [Haloferula sp. A504]|uniref:RibD family protein n=1 Tax=Haloferula sp. A504 TaxID=3373601 RepID=UPI0031CABD25|nr:RibD family protein [Verrucomicrobiaceae bacterium E54]
MSAPRISINFAVSADGKITSVEGRPSGWTSDADHERLLELRQTADALMVGRGTLEADRMTMKAPQQPLRCIVSGRGRFDPGHPVFSTDGGPIHLLGTGGQPNAIPGTTTHHMSLPDFLEYLHREQGVRHLHCEGGGHLGRSLAELDLIDEIHLTWAGHKLFGGAAAPGITAAGGEFLPASRAFRLTHFEPREELGEVFLSYERTQ